jgi:hypothetical protein
MQGERWREENKNEVEANKSKETDDDEIQGWLIDQLPVIDDHPVPMGATGIVNRGHQDRESNANEKGSQKNIAQSLKGFFCHC